ncbi:MAG: hypothetical protein DRO11_07170 [Methanobacteriota archaeon]|nr:MAG: hypothetical protein DRO11_07170 [Euryarchaeota archaeon]
MGVGRGVPLCLILLVLFPTLHAGGDETQLDKSFFVADDGSPKAIIVVGSKATSGEVHRVIDLAAQIGNMVCEKKKEELLISIPGVRVRKLVVLWGEKPYVSENDGSVLIDMVLPRRLGVPLVYLDHEVSQEVKTGNNLVLVGGPESNLLVAELQAIGKTRTAFSDLPPGTGEIELVRNGFAEGYDVLILGAPDSLGVNKLVEEVLHQIRDK